MEEQKPEIINKKKYDHKKYYQNFKLKNIEKIKKPCFCDICGNTYTYFTKSKHLKSKTHNKAIYQNNSK